MIRVGDEDESAVPLDDPVVATHLRACATGIDTAHSWVSLTEVVGVLIVQRHLRVADAAYPVAPRDGDREGALTGVGGVSRMVQRSVAVQLTIVRGPLW